jgi:hypothetical protein
MLRRKKSRGYCGLSIAAAAVFAAGLNFASSAHAETLSSGNSDLTINTSGPNPFITSWTVDGVDQYDGTPAGSEDLQISIDGGALQSINTLTVSGTPFAVGGLATTVYEGDGFTLTVDTTLTGGTPGSGTSALVDQITINNTQEIPAVVTSNIVATNDITFRLVEVSNVTLDSLDTNTLNLSPSVSPNTATYTNSLGTTVTITPDTTPNSFTAGTVGSESNSSTGPFVGNVGFTFEWDGTIDPGGSYQVSMPESVTGATSGGSPPAVPLPSSAYSSFAALLGLGGIAAVRRMRKQTA